MLKQVKKFWDAFGDKAFFGKIVLPSLAIFFTLGTLAQYYCNSLDKEDLVKTAGKIENIDEIVEYGVRMNKYQPLMIYVVGQETPFRVNDNFKYRFNALKQQIVPGDNVILYTRTDLQTFLGWGQQNDVFQIEEGGNILFELDWMKESKKSQSDTFAFLTIICWGLYGGYRYNRYSEKKAAANKMYQ